MMVALRPWSALWSGYGHFKSMVRASPLYFLQAIASLKFILITCFAVSMYLIVWFNHIDIHILGGVGLTVFLAQSLVFACICVRAYVLVVNTGKLYNNGLPLELLLCFMLVYVGWPRGICMLVLLLQSQYRRP